MSQRSMAFVNLFHNRGDSIDAVPCVYGEADHENSVELRICFHSVTIHSMRPEDLNLLADRIYAAARVIESKRAVSGESLIPVPTGPNLA